MKCLDRPLKYKGQTGRIFHTTYKEHIQAIRNNNSNLGYSSHILNMEYTYMTTGKMDIIRTQKKGKHLEHLRKNTTYAKSVKITNT
jgi:hypothetical protein